MVRDQSGDKHTPLRVSTHWCCLDTSPQSGAAGAATALPRLRNLQTHGIHVHARRRPLPICRWLCRLRSGILEWRQHPRMCSSPLHPHSCPSSMAAVPGATLPLPTHSVASRAMYCAHGAWSPPEGLGARLCVVAQSGYGRLWRVGWSVVLRTWTVCWVAPAFAGVWSSGPVSTFASVSLAPPASCFEAAEASCGRSWYGSDPTRHLLYASSRSVGTHLLTSELQA